MFLISDCAYSVFKTYHICIDLIHNKCMSTISVPLAVVIQTIFTGSIHINIPHTHVISLRILLSFYMGNPTQSTMSGFSLELEMTCAAPALANAALLFAEGCAQKYIEVINVLYLANSLPCPNLQPLLRIKPISCEKKTLPNAAEASLSFPNENDDNVVIKGLAYPPEELGFQTCASVSINPSSPDSIFENTEWFTYNMLESITEPSDLKENCELNPPNKLELIPETSVPNNNHEWTPISTLASIPDSLPVDDWAPLSAFASTPRSSIIPNELVKTENWQPLSRLSAFDSTPMLNKIGITNPSPGAYYYLDLMSRHKKLLFDISVDSVPDTILDTVIEQAETLSSPKCDFNTIENCSYRPDIEDVVTKLSLVSPTQTIEPPPIRSSSISRALGQPSVRQRSQPNTETNPLTSSLNERSRLGRSFNHALKSKSFVHQHECKMSGGNRYNKKNNIKNMQKFNSNATDRTKIRWRN